MAWKQQYSGIKIKWLEIRLDYLSLFFEYFSRKLANVVCFKRLFFSLLAILGLELMASCMLGKPSITVLYLQPYEVDFQLLYWKEFYNKWQEYFTDPAWLSSHMCVSCRAQAVKLLASTP